MIKNIVFDMGGVLITYDSRSVARSYTENDADGLLLWEEAVHSVEWLKMDRGTIQEEEAVISICKRLPNHLHENVRKFMREWHHSLPPFPEMEELIRRLKDSGYRIYLLSNTSVRFHEFRKGIPALKYFDGEFISADWHLLKPEPEIYQAFFQHYGLVPAECFFIDDMPANIEAADRAGMCGYVYHEDIARLEQALRNAGVQV